MSLVGKLNSAILVLVGLLQLQCLGDAPRDNPLDSKSSRFQNSAAIKGIALSLFPPFQPIAGVELRLSPGNFLGMTDVAGEFVFRDIPSGTFVVTASKPRFGTVVDSVEVSAGDSVAVTFNLNGLPEVDSIAVFSCRFNNLFPVPDVRFLQVEVKVTDFDGVNDVRLVEFLIPGTSFVDTLAATPVLGMFSKVINEVDLPVVGLENLVGRPLLIRVTDGAGFATTSQPVFLTRVIAEDPQTISPDGFELLSDRNPVLTWRAVDLPFSFSHTVEVVRFRPGVETVVWTQEGINSLQTSIQVAPQLLPGSTFSYFWTVSVVDEFGNWSRSIESSFRIN